MLILKPEATLAQTNGILRGVSQKRSLPSRRRPRALVLSKSKKSNSSGFTLVEMMVVLGIMAAIIALGLGRIRKRDNDIKKVARQFYVLGKELRNQARLKGSTYRLMIRLDEGAQSYWVESAQGFKARLTPDEVKDLEDLNEEERPREVFAKDGDVLKKEKELPDGLFFKSVESLDSDPMTSGTATIYFFPNGFVETTALQITDRKKLTWTLIYQPLTGQADIVTEARGLRDAKRD